MTESWSKLRIPRARLSPSGPVPVAGPRTGPPTGEQLAGLAVLAAIAAQQEAAYAAERDAVAAQQEAGGDQLAALLADIEATQHDGSSPY